MSSFAWLDFAEHERRRALEVVQMFQQRETVDELGIGTIRDAISELLFPGTSVIHTRARYFFFIPWLYLDLERRRVPSERIRQQARLAEVNLIEALLRSDDKEGIIGSRARKTLRILPSAIYWQALRREGILRFGGTREQYHRSLDRFYLQRQRALRTDDGEPLDFDRRDNWDARLPDAPDDFPGAADLALRPAEAEYLRARIVQAGPASLYRHMVEDPDSSPEQVDFPWEYTRLADLPADLQSTIEHARRFSLAIHGAPLLYNLMLAEMRQWREKVEEYRERLSSWVEEHASEAAVLDSWDRRAFWKVIERSQARVPLATRDFVDRWLDLTGASAGRDLTGDAGARRLVREREHLLKRGQARLANRSALQQWQGDSGTARLSYRCGIASRMARDLAEAFLREPPYA